MAKVPLKHSNPEEHRRQIAFLVNRHAEEKVDARQFIIADDSVAEIKPPRNGGLVGIVTGGNTETPEHTLSGLVYYDVGTDRKAEKNTGWATLSSGLDTVTTDVTGTSGTDGNVTVSAQAGAVKIENRSGAAQAFFLTFL